MATNRVYEHGTQIPAAPTAPAAPTSGDPVLVGQLPGVALIDADDDGALTVQTDGVFDLEVTGHNGTAGAAITAGDLVYADATTAALTVNAGGVRFGYALEDVAADATTTIRVKVGY